MHEQSVNETKQMLKLIDYHESHITFEVLVYIVLICCKFDMV